MAAAVPPRLAAGRLCPRELKPFAAASDLYRSAPARYLLFARRRQRPRRGRTFLAYLVHGRWLAGDLLLAHQRYAGWPGMGTPWSCARDELSRRLRHSPPAGAARGPPAGLVGYGTRLCAAAWLAVDRQRGHSE